MSLLDLNADTISSLDEGRAKALFNAAMADLMKDLEDRGDDGKPRTLEMKLTFTKVRGNIAMDIQVAPKMPAYRSNQTIGKIVQRQARGGVYNAFVFQEDDADNPDQGTLDYPEDSEAGE